MYPDYKYKPRRKSKQSEYAPQQPKHAMSYPFFGNVEKQQNNGPMPMPNTPPITKNYKMNGQSNTPPAAPNHHKMNGQFGSDFEIGDREVSIEKNEVFKRDCYQSLNLVRILKQA